MNIYKNCNITTSRFFYILKTNDFRALVKEFDIHDNDDDFKYVGDEDLSSVFKDLFHEYCELSRDKSTLLMYNQQLYISDLELEYSTISNVLDLYAQTNDIEILKCVSKFYDKYQINEDKDVNVEVNKIISKLKGLKNRINIKKISYDKKYGKKDKSKNEINLDKIAFSIEKALDLKYSINPDETTLKRWVTLFDIANSKKK